jgi:peroxin-5
MIYLSYMITAELEQGEALRYLSRWLQNHPKYGALAAPHQTDSPYGPDVSEGYVIHNDGVSNKQF